MRENWLRVKAYGEKQTVHPSYDQKVSVTLIIFRGKSVDNKMILKWCLQVSRRALVNLGFHQI